MHRFRIARREPLVHVGACHRQSSVHTAPTIQRGSQGMRRLLDIVGLNPFHRVGHRTAARPWLRSLTALLLGLGLACAAPAADAPAQPLKVAFVYVGPVGDGGWSYQHNLGRLALEKALGNRVKTTYVDSVAEGADAERVIRRLATSGNSLIFTTSFGFMEATLKVA